MGKDSRGRLEEKGLNLRRNLQPLGQCGFSRVPFESYLQRWHPNLALFIHPSLSAITMSSFPPKQSHS